MKKDMRAHVNGARILTSLWTGLLKAVDGQGGNPDCLGVLHENKDPRVIALFNRWAKELINFRGEVFNITRRGKFSTSELVKLGEYDWLDDLIADDLFPLRNHTEEYAEVELLKIPYTLGSEEILRELGRHNLDQPTIEDAFCFGIDCPEEQRKYPIVFLHEPVYVKNGSGEKSLVLVLCGHASSRGLGLGRFGKPWCPDYVFAGIRRRPVS